MDKECKGKLYHFTFELTKKIRNEEVHSEIGNLETLQPISHYL